MKNVLDLFQKVNEKRKDLLTTAKKYADFLKLYSNDLETLDKILKDLRSFIIEPENKKVEVGISIKESSLKTLNALAYDFEELNQRVLDNLDKENKGVNEELLSLFAQTGKMIYNIKDTFQKTTNKEHFASDTKYIKEALTEFNTSKISLHHAGLGLLNYIRSLEDLSPLHSEEIEKKEELQYYSDKLYKQLDISNEKLNKILDKMETEKIILLLEWYIWYILVLGQSSDLKPYITVRAISKELTKRIDTYND